MYINFSPHEYHTGQHLASLLFIWTPCPPVAARLNLVVTCVMGFNPSPCSVYGSPSAPLAVWGGLFILWQLQWLALHWLSHPPPAYRWVGCGIHSPGSAVHGSHCHQPLSIGSQCCCTFEFLPWHHIVLTVSCVNTMFTFFKDTGYFSLNVFTQDLNTGHLHKDAKYPLLTQEINPLHLSLRASLLPAFVGSSSLQGGKFVYSYVLCTVSFLLPLF